MLRLTALLSFGLVIATPVLEYGEFDIKILKFELCKGPRRKFCGDVKVNLFNDCWLKFDVKIKEDMTKIKTLFVGTLNNKEIIRLRMNNLCDHIFFKPIMQSISNVTGGHCGIYKGRTIFNVDIQAISRTLYGNKFVYGNWTYKSVFFNDNCNLHCQILQMMVTPKK